ncbi:MAG: hypothetical protein WCF26_07235 [Candidatus Sulfotelmatobacter sp.]
MEKLITEQKDKERYMFELQMNIVPLPFGREGRKRCEIVKSRDEMVPWTYYWVRVWTGGGDIGNWALCEYVEAVEGGAMRFHILAAHGNPEKLEYVTMLAPALRRKQIRVARQWSPLEYEEILDRTTTITPTEGGMLAEIDPTYTEPRQ